MEEILNLNEAVDLKNQNMNKSKCFLNHKEHKFELLVDDTHHSGYKKMRLKCLNETCRKHKKPIPYDKSVLSLLSHCPANIEQMLII